MSECSKLEQKEYKSWHNDGGKVIHRELFKCLNFDHRDKWYWHRPEFLLENEIYKIPQDFVMEMEHPIPSRKADLVLLVKRKEYINF